MGRQRLRNVSRHFEAFGDAQVASEASDKRGDRSASSRCPVQHEPRALNRDAQSAGFVEAVDKLLYAAKEKGRNRIEASQL